MRFRSSVPGEQLRSAAARYQRPLQPPTAARGLPPRGAVLASLAEGASCWDRTQAGDGHDVRLQRLEAVLFLAREPMPSRKLSYYANLADGTEARTLIRRLNQQYDEVGRAFRVEEFAGGFQLLTRPQFASWLRRLEHIPPETRLSAPALETLAVVAYRQPVLRADIEAIRGVSCGEILRQLMERDLVRISGRSEELGRPYLYATTKRFLQLMGLPNLEQLPRAEDLREAIAESQGPESQGPESQGPESQGPESQGPESLGPESLGPESLGPESQGPESLGPESLGPESQGAVQEIISRDNQRLESSSDPSRDVRQPEEAEMIATETDPRQTVPLDESPVAAGVSTLAPQNADADADEDDDEYEYEYEDDEDDDEAVGDDEAAGDEAAGDDADGDDADGDDADGDDADGDDADGDDADGGDADGGDGGEEEDDADEFDDDDDDDVEEEDADEAEEEEDEWEEVDDDEEWDDEEMDWEDEYDEMEE